MKRLHFFLLTAALVLAPAGLTSAFAQRIQNGNYSTIGYIKSDGTVQDGSYRTIGHIKSDGTVQDGSYKTIGHCDSGIRTTWIAWFFFFRK